MMQKYKAQAFRLAKGLMAVMLCFSIAGCKKEKPVKKTEAQIESELIKRSSVDFLKKKIKFTDIKTDGYIDQKDYNKNYVTEVDSTIPSRLQKVSFKVKNTSLRTVSFSFNLTGIRSGKDKYHESADLSSREVIPLVHMHDDMGEGKGTLINGTYVEDEKRFYNSAFNTIALRMSKSYMSQYALRQTVTYLKPGEEREYHVTLFVMNYDYNDESKPEYLFIPETWKNIKPKFFDSNGLTAFSEKEAKKQLICYDSRYSKAITFNNPKMTKGDDKKHENTDSLYYTGSVTNTTDDYLASVVVYFDVKFDTLDTVYGTDKKITSHHEIIDCVRFMNLRPHQTYNYREQTREGVYKMMMDIKSVKVSDITYYVDYTHKKSETIQIKNAE